jgi:hypothetical protein
MDTLKIVLGFKMDGVFFGYLDGVIYQLPYEYNGRFFGLREVRKKQTKKGWTYYRLRRKKVGLEKIKALVQKVDWEVVKPMDL